MEINNNIKVVKSNIEKADETKTQKPKETYTQTKSGLLLPDIRGNQVLLPDNKIYMPKGARPTTFNKDGLSAELPSTYKVVKDIRDIMCTFA